MVEDSRKEDEPKLEFDSAGQAVAYVSLDQARVLTMQQARGAPCAYGRRHRRVTLVWEVQSEEEGEDFFDVRLFFTVPGGRRWSLKSPAGTSKTCLSKWDSTSLTTCGLWVQGSNPGSNTDREETSAILMVSNGFASARAGPEPGPTYDGWSGDWSGTFPWVVYLYQVNGMGVLKMSGVGDAVK